MGDSTRHRIMPKCLHSNPDSMNMQIRTAPTIQTSCRTSVDGLNLHTGILLALIFYDVIALICEHKKIKT